MPARMVDDPRKGKNSRAWQKRRAQVIASNDICALCGKRVDKRLRWPDRRSPSVDHVVPVIRGGTDDPSNLRLVHLGCNSSKGAREQQSPRSSRSW